MYAPYTKKCLLEKFRITHIQFQFFIFMIKFPIMQDCLPLLIAPYDTKINTDATKRKKTSPIFKSVTR